MIQDIICPDNIAILKTDSSYSIVSLKKFKKGDIIFKNTSIVFNTNIVKEIKVNMKVLYKNIFQNFHNPIDETIKLDYLVHTVNNGNGMREYYSYDSFSNHSCDPNAEMITTDKYITGSDYKIVANKDIEYMEEITQDYETFDTMLDGTTFNCRCNSNCCRKIIRG